MALEVVDKMRIGKYLKTTALDELCWGGFFENARKDKYSDYDVLVFLVDSFLTKISSASVSSEKLLTKYLVYINNFFWWANEKKQPAIQVIAKIKVLEEKYLEYIEKTGQEKSESIITTIKSMVELIEDEFGKDEETKDGEVSKYVASILEMEATIKELTTQLDEARRTIATLEKSKTDTSKKKKKNEDDITELKNKVAKYEKLIEDLNKELTELRSKSDATQADYDALLVKFNNVSSQKDDLVVELKEAKKTIDSQAKKITKFEKKEEERVLEVEQAKSKLAFEKELDDKIIGMLFGGQYTVDQIVKKLNRKEGEYTAAQVSESLERVKLRLSILNPKAITYPQEYGVCAPGVRTHTNLNLNANGEVIDILFIADLHLTDISNKVIKRMNAVYEYCALNGIKYIMNLGDLFDLTRNSTFNAETYGEHQKLLDAIVRHFPQDDSIVHFVLGGNHDRNATAFGIDSIEELARRREDIVSLGYSHSTIGINGNKNNELIGIHHPNGWVVDTIDDFDLGASRINNYLESSCSGLDRNYIDLFGHFHASRLDTVNGFGSIPSLFYDKERSGAWHVKVYLDENKNIKHIVFIQLLAEKSLYKVSEVGYQKTMK